MNENEYIPGADVQAVEDNTPDFMQQDDWYEAEIDSNWLDVTKDFKMPEYLFRINGVECFPLGGIQGVTGQAGSGKTQIMSMMIAGVLGDTTHNIEYCLKDDQDQIIKERKVLYIDTEMEEGNTQLVNCRVCAMLNWDYKVPHDGTDPRIDNSKQVRYLRLRDELTAVDRWKKILKAVYFMRENLRLVIIDGLIDVIGDFNDNKECQEIMFKLMSVSEHYHIALCSVLHQNPNSDKMVGHGGSFLERKATDIIESVVEVDDFTGDVTFKVRHKKARSKRIPEYKFCVDDSIYKFGVASILNKSATEKLQESEDQQLNVIMQKYLTEPLSQTVLQAKIKEGEHIGSDKAYKWILKADTAKIIEKGKNKKYYYIGKQELNKTTKIQFTENTNELEF